MLPDGAAMLLFTDGLVERRGEDLQTRTERLRRLAQPRRGDDDLEGWVDRLVAAHGDSDDDTTVLAVRRRATRPEPAVQPG